MPITNLQMDHAVAALVELLTFTHPADAVLSRYFREHPKLGSRDRAFVAETVFAILRHKRLLEHWAGSQAPRPLLLTYLARIEGMNLRQLEPLLKARDRDWFGQMKARSSEDLPLSVQADFPDWLVDRLRATRSDADILELGRAMQNPAPLDLLRSEIVRLEPQMVYFPLAIGGHVDHRLCRDVGVALLGEGPRWVMPGPGFVGRVSFYEDFPYAWWGEGRSGFDDAAALDLPVGVNVEAQYSDISDVLSRKAAGIRVYASQLPRLFETDQAMLDDLASFHAQVALAGGVRGYAERYWATVKP